MNRTKLIIGLVVIVTIVVVAAVAALVLNRPAKNTGPVIEPTIGPSLSPSPSPTESAPPGPNEGGEVAGEKQIVAFYNQPILKALPTNNAYWTLKYVGSENGTYRLSATVFVRSGQDAQTVLTQQKPYILDFIKHTGQPDGTYAVNYKTEPLVND